MNKRVMVAGALATLLALGSGTVRAEPGWYFGVAFGPSNAELDEGLVAAAGGGGDLVRDERDPGFAVRLGYRFSDYAAAEGGYLGLGEFRVGRNLAAPAGATNATNADVRVKGLLLSAVGRLPLGYGITAFAKAGVLLSETKTFRATSGGASFARGAAGSAIVDEINPAWGLGLEYEFSAFSPKTALRLEWDRFLRVGEAASTGETDLDFYAVGLSLRF